MPVNRYGMDITFSPVFLELIKGSQINNKIKNKKERRTIPAGWGSEKFIEKLSKCKKGKET
jgi:hypothetical protein